MIGAVKNAINYMQLFDYFLLASIHEGFPNSLIESMSEGLIPFTTDCGDSLKLFPIIEEQIESPILNQLQIYNKFP